MTDLEDWRVFIREFSDLDLVQVIHDLREHPEDKDYLRAVLEELRARARARVGTGAR